MWVRKLTKLWIKTIMVRKGEKQQVRALRRWQSKTSQIARHNWINKRRRKPRVKIRSSTTTVAAKASWILARYRHACELASSPSCCVCVSVCLHNVYLLIMLQSMVYQPATSQGQMVSASVLCPQSAAHSILLQACVSYGLLSLLFLLDFIRYMQPIYLLYFSLSLTFIIFFLSVCHDIVIMQPHGASESIYKSISVSMWRRSCWVRDLPFLLCACMHAWVSKLVCY